MQTKIRGRHIFAALSAFVFLVLLVGGIVFWHGIVSFQRFVYTEHFKVMWLVIGDYADAHQGRLPPMSSAEEMKTHLLQSVKGADERYFYQPKTREPYQPNPLLSGRSITSIEHPYETVLLYEKSPTSNGARAVMYLDGHINWLTDREWEKLSSTVKPKE